MGRRDRVQAFLPSDRGRGAFERGVSRELRPRSVETWSGRLPMRSSTLVSAVLPVL